MGRIKFNKNDIIRHVSVWSLILLYVFVFDFGPDKWYINTILIIFNVSVDAFTYYSFCLFIFPRYWNSRLLMMTIMSVVLLGIYFGLGCFSVYYLSLKLSISQDFNTPIAKLLVNTIIYFFVLGGASLSFFLGKYNKYKTQHRHEKEMALLLKDLLFYQNQFNSHITFNFLNYCYKQIHNHSNDVAQAIEIYSEMLRYTLDRKYDEKVRVDDEIIYLENFIALRKKLNPATKIEFHHSGQLSNKFIISRVLITFLENALKHGVSNDIENPIRVDLAIMEGELIFKVINKINHERKVLSTGTGLENVRQTLNLHYMGNYSLGVNSDEDFFAVELKIQLINESGSIKKNRA